MNPASIPLFQRSLNLKVLAPLMVLGCLIGTLSGLVSRHVYQGIFNDEIRKRAELLADTIVYAAETCSNLDDISHTVKQWSTQQDVKWIAIAGIDPQRVLASSNKENVGKALSDLHDPAKQILLTRVAKTQIAEMTFDESIQECLIGRPLSLQLKDSNPPFTLGVVGVGLNTRGFHDKLQTTLVIMIIKQIVTIFLIAILAYFLLQKLVLQPTKLLNHTMIRRTTGDRTAYAPLFSPDEIGSLARHLNTMLETLDESQIHVTTILNTVEDGIITSDVNGIIQNYNHAAETIFGYQASEVIGKNVTILMPPEVAREHDRYLLEYKQTRIQKIIGHSRELEALRKDGTRFPISLTVSEMRVGEKVSYVGTIRDITQQKEHERTIHQRIALEQLISTISSRFISITPEQFEHVMNRSLRDIGEFCNAERCYVSIFSENGLVLEQTSEWCASGIEPQIRRMQHVPQEKFPYFLQHMQNNVTFYIPQLDELPKHAVAEINECNIRGVQSIMAVPLICDDKLYGFLGLDWIHQSQPWLRSDISFFKTIGEILVNAFARYRTIEQLHLAKDAAVSAAKAKSEFLANMSHEIRTPLNGVMGMVNLALDSPLSPAQRDYLTTAQKSADSLLHIINDILDFSKIDAGKLVFECIPFHLRESIEDLSYPIAMRAQKKGIDLFLRYDSSAPCMVMGDEGRVRQVITNLAENAVKFTASGSVFINVNWESKTDESAFFHIAVTDTGIGIPEEKQSTIFEQFNQVDTSTTRRFGGTGLGLAISKQLVELMGGAIGFTSRPGDGSTFHITIPLPLASRDETPSFPEPFPKDTPVLFVSESELNSSILAEQLNSLKIRFITSSSFEEALTMLQSAADTTHPYRIVILGRSHRHTERQQFAQNVLSNSAFSTVGLAVLSPIGDSLPIRWQIDTNRSINLETPVRLQALHYGLSELWRKLLNSMNESSNHQTPNRPPSNEPATNSGPHAFQSDYPIHILVAEDSDVNQRVAKLMLERMGIIVDIARNGNEAVKMCDTINYNAILMDCQMPELDGFEATKAIRQNEIGTNRHIPIIALTAHAMKQDREDCLNAGMDDYISKPIQPGQLQQILTKYLVKQTEFNNAAEEESTETRGDAMILYMPEKEFEDRFGGDWELLIEMIELFLQHESEFITDIQSAIENNNAVELKSAAHRLKGSIANFGTGLGYQLAAQLEIVGMNADLTHAKDLFQQLAEEMIHFRAKGEAILSRSSSE